MNNEIGRKITSLTLMTIMIAGGLTIAAPGMMPAAFAANANLFVSAENSQFDNYMSGPQVIEVVVIDSDINDTNEAKGEPDVTVNGKILRMVQAVDGNWYGYFADRRMAQIADSTAVANSREGLDFGQFCSGTSAAVILQGTGPSTVDFSDTNGVAIPTTTGGNEGSASGASITNTCTAGTSITATTTHPRLNVVREAKQVNTNNPDGNDGQINVAPAFWPFVQLYTLNPTGNVVIQYNKGGGAQTTTLTFDTVDQFAGAELDKSTYTKASQVHATLTDLWLNIDPTDEDSWTFGTTGFGSSAAATTHYQVFDENGNSVGDTATNTNTSLTAKLGALMCEDNCRLITNADVQNKGAVITLQDNDDSNIAATAGGSDPQNPLDWATGNGNISGNVPITVTEQGPNSGVFGSYDESDTSAIIITTAAKRGTSASIDYNETPVTILVGFSFGSVNIQPTDEEWSSGEEIPVTIVDADANRNSRADEDLDFNNPSVLLIPAMKTGSPDTLKNLKTAGLTGTLGSSLTVDTVQAFSDRAILRSSGLTVTTGSTLTFSLGTAADFNKAAPLNNNSFRGAALLNYDLRSFANDGNAEGISSVAITVNGVSLGAGHPLQGLVVISDATGGASNFPSGIAPTATFTFTTSTPGPIAINTLLPVAVDVFGFGFIDDGVEAAERVSNQIVRIEAEETGDNTSTFEGSLEYTMVNQLNILDLATYTGLTPIANDPTFIVIEDLTDEDAPRVNYLDLGADGVSTQVSDQEEAPSHSGIVSFDNDSYKVADTVLVTLEDKDLNVDSDLIDIFTVVDGTIFTDPARDAVGEAGLPEYSFGPLGRLMDITFDDVAWQASETCTPTGGADEGLGASGFSLIETGVESGIFTGDFQIPSNWCRPGALLPETTTGLDLEVNYVDFRDASGEIIEVGDAAGVRANTGSVSLDRTVYPVPFGVPADFGTLTGATAPDNRSIFPIHATGINTDGNSNDANDLTVPGSFLPNGDLTIHVRVNDPDFDISASGEDQINLNTAASPIGPVKLSVIRGSSTVILGYAGGPSERDGTINVGTVLRGDGMIQTDELTIPSNTGFVTSGANVTISQTGNTQNAIASFTDSNAGLVEGMELSIQNNFNGYASQTVSIFNSTTNKNATGVWTDANGDTNLDNNEVKVSSSDVFGNGPVTVYGVACGYCTLANAIFTDAVKIDSADELTILNGGAGFKTGKVTLTQGAASVVADFLDTPTVRQFGPITEIAPDAGIFEEDIVIRYTDGPSSTICPETLVFEPTDGTTGTGELNRFSTESATDRNYCILQGDILQVEYTDPADASGDVNTVTDSATFDLRNGVLQSDKSVYIIGSDMILTLIEPDFDLDNDAAETYDLDLIEWDSDAATVTMGNADGEQAAFDPEPTDFRETGDSTGIFQIVIEIPSELQGDLLERGEEIVLEYTDWGPSGSDFVGDEDEDVNLTIYTSNFGATVELDQKVYTWTDKVYITIVAPDHNFDSNLIDEIGNTDKDPIKVSTRGDDIDNYKLVETGTDTGIFTGEVILTGFTHDADGDTRTGDDNGNDVVSRAPSGHGPTDGLLPADDDDGITVSFEFSEDETVVGSALIRWNIGEVQWLEASYPASGTGVVRVIDPDMNLDPEAVDNFDVDVWSDSDAGGIDLTVTETNEATGIFEGTVFFTIRDESSGHRLRVAEGDTVTAEYADNTLPDPYTTADELDIAATSLIGTVVPPLERAPASNCRVVDSFGNTLSSVSVDQQVQITCDVSNGQDREQPFAYLIQIQDANGVTVSLAWITGSLSPGQSFSPALSWIPENSGSFDVTAFVWESVDNPTALSPPQDTSITVN